MNKLVDVIMVHIYICEYSNYLCKWRSGFAVVITFITIVLLMVVVEIHCKLLVVLLCD